MLRSDMTVQQAVGFPGGVLQDLLPVFVERRRAGSL
jgi:hypothetical protein